MRTKKITTGRDNPIFDMFMDIIERNRLMKTKIEFALEMSSGRIARMLRGRECLNIHELEKFCTLLGYEVLIIKKKKVPLDEFIHAKRQKKNG